MDMKRTIAIAAAVLALSATLLASVPASASARKTEVPWEGLGWRNMMAKPSAMYTGRNAPNGRPYVLFIQWQNWKKVSAYGHGYLQVRGGQRRIAILLYRVREHRGIRYFSRMTWKRAHEKTRWSFKHREWVRT